MPDTNETLREVVETLASLTRRAGSDDERRAAEWIADRFERAAAPATIDEELFYDGYAMQLLPLGVTGAIAGALAAAGRRLAPALLGGLAAAAIADDASNGRRVWRKLIQAPKRTWNVVAQVGDPAAERTLVVLGHHDAAPTGRVFDPTPQLWLAKQFPDLVARSNTSLPLWWPVAGAPALAALAGLGGRRGVARLAFALSVWNVYLGLDVARNRVVPGANDNLSAVAAMVALAEHLREAPVEGVRIVLASCGAEEVLQGGIYGFLERHLRHLPRESTWVLNLDTVGSPALVMLEGEGTFKMEDYTDPGFRDLVEAAADRAEISLYRGVRSRASTDSVIPSRAGYPTATIVSWEPKTKLPTNYHLMTDTPDNLDYDTVAQSARLAYAVAQAVAAG